jgi:hypothetical protein
VIVESVVSPVGLAVTYVRTAIDEPPGMRVGDTEGWESAAGSCVMPGCVPGRSTTLGSSTGRGLLAVAEHAGTRHEVLVAAGPHVAEPALWAAVDLIAPIGGWRVSVSELDAIRRREQGDDPGERSGVVDEATAVVRAALEPSVILQWDELGARSLWSVASSSGHDRPSVTIAAAADAHHVDVWRTSLGALRDAIAERLHRRGGTLTVDGVCVGPSSHADAVDIDAAMAVIAAPRRNVGRSPARGASPQGSN